VSGGLRTLRSWRAVIIGTIFAVALAILVPINDLLLGNGFIVGSYLPVGVVLPLLLLAVGVNPLLLKFKPAWAFRQRELGTIFALTLLASAVMGQGLVRTLLPAMIGPPWLASQDQRFAETLHSVDVPPALFPAPLRAGGPSQPLVDGFYGRVHSDDLVPWRGWVLPLLWWTPFVGGSLLSLVALGLIMRRQWAEGERLPFPLAQVERSLVAEPAAGRYLNETLGSRAMWLTALAVAVAHGSTLGAKYLPRLPVIGLSADLAPYFRSTILEHLPAHVTSFTLMFSIVGLAFFVQARVTGSIVFFVLLTAAIECARGVGGAAIHGDAWTFQGIGAGLAIMAFTLFMARGWLRRVFIAAFTLSGGVDGRNAELAIERRAAWALLLGLLLMFGWLCFAGMQIGPALFVVASVLFIHYVSSRVVAETGVPFYRFQAETTRLAELVPTSGATVTDAFLAGQATMVAGMSSRQSSMALAQHAAIVAELDGQSPPQRRRMFVGAMIALALAAVAGVAAALWVSYRFDGAIAVNAPQGLEDPIAMRDWPAGIVMEFASRVRLQQTPYQPFDPAMHAAIGLGVTSMLFLFTARINWWPLAPIGYLLCHSWYIRTAWVSLMLGMLAKHLMLKFGGAKQLQAARPIFIGLVLGEALSLGFWLLLSLVLAAVGEPFYSVTLLPR
jgi:hypothetical protein